MRLSSVFIRASTFMLAALLSVVAARATVSKIESRSIIGVREELLDYGHDWVTVIGDGLQVILEGQAPSEAERFRAISLSGRVVDASRVIDNMSVVASAGIAAPAFAIEILRNDSGVSLIGLVPASLDRTELSERISRLAAGAEVTDLLESADYTAPDDWRPAVNYALNALDRLPRSKISVAPGRVSITAISDSAEQKANLETSLVQQIPPLVDVTLDVSAPRPVVSPYITRFTIDETGARFDACTADTQSTLTRIVDAAKEAGLRGNTNCILALGVPSKTWGEAAAQSIKAIGELGGGVVTLSDADIALVATEETPQALFDQVVGELENNLPELFVLEATLPKPLAEDEEGPPQFIAILSPEGLVQLRGLVPDELVNVTAENYALARFGRSNVAMGTRLTDGLPNGWSVRVLTAIEALSHLNNGSVTVEPNSIVIKGNTGNESASSDIAGILIERLGQTEEFDIQVNYVEKLDPIASLPTDDECIAQLTELNAERKITFDPSSATISAESLQLVDDIAEVLRLCLDLELEIAGFTDSQGREEMNLQLSQERAQSVLTALHSRRIPTGAFVARGYGEADPIADNGTEEGREANRRIEFRLIKAEPIVEEPTALELLEESNLDTPSAEATTDADVDAEETDEATTE